MKHIFFSLMLLFGLGSVAKADRTVAAKQDFVKLLFNKADQSKSGAKILRVMRLVANRDIEALKALDLEDLHFGFNGDEGTIFVDGKHRADYLSKAKIEHQINEDGSITTWENGIVRTMRLFGIGCDNALVCVVLHSVLDATAEEKNATLQMLQVLIDKSLSPNAQYLFFLFKGKPNGQHFQDNISGAHHVIEVAQFYSSPEVVQYLKEACN